MITTTEITAMKARAEEIINRATTLFKSQAAQYAACGCPLVSAEMIGLANHFALVFGDPANLDNLKTANDDYRATLSPDYHLCGYPIE
jgi:hypothetical protein